MPSPFPGMDPYLERPGVWQQIHTTLIVEMQYYLTPLLRPRYHVAIEQSTYLTLLPPPDQRIGIPDVVVTERGQSSGSAQAAQILTTVAEPIVAELPQLEEIQHRYLEIRDTETQEVITTIELLSPANKIGRQGREQYENKRPHILSSLTNLVEIDLLRTGDPMPMKTPYQNDYRIAVSRSYQRPRADVYLFSVRDPIPDFPIPLRRSEEEPALPLNRLLHDLYDKGGYDLVIDYRQSAIPPISDEDREWLNGLIASTD